ncbi:hypothetical protein BT93_L2068 [Corymbia citriodora subsp. variegata]|uniref:Cytochrome P450 n=1 Tax=Corymbia citriodora subsp. variegata TaxID=360336 RepID=A0A8T0CQM9_CORYI|nr:hypothetical protein BT93_L2068 [Corymbia citriodora subsp. variegata]
MLLCLGSVPTIVLSSPEVTKEVLRTHDLDCCSRSRLAGTRHLSYGSLDMAFIKYGGYWRELKKLCMLELFSVQRVQSFRYIREHEVASMVELIVKSAESKIPVNMSEKFMTLTANFTCRVAFGKAFQGTEFNDGKFMDMIHEAMAMLGSFSASDFFPRFGWIGDRFTGLHSRLEKSFRTLDVFYQKVIEEHRNANKSDEEEEDIVDLLLKMERDETELAGVQLKEDNIKAILMLARNPRAMRKAQEEIRRCVGNKKCVVEDDLSGLKYLNLVLKEAMRLHPPGALLLPRETRGHFKLFDYDVDLKSRVQVNIWGIGRDPSLWERPEEFVPERFEDSLIDYKGNHFELLPFGAGRRGCPGMSMAMVMIELALANVLRSFDWELPEGMTEEM